MNYTIKAIIVIAAILAVVTVISLTVVIVLAAAALPLVTIDRQLSSIEEQEDGSIEVYDRSNNTQIASFDNVGEMLQGMPKVIQNMIGYYADKNLTDIIVIR